MEVRLLNFLRGYVRIRIIGNSYDRFLNLCAYHGIFLWDLQPLGESYEAFVSVKDFKRLKAIVKKSRTEIEITRRCGLPFFIHKYRKRKFYAISIAAAAAFMLWLSAHIWNITIEGNLSQTDDVIFEYLEDAGVRHGMPKSSVDCKELAAEIRNYFTQFAWVAAELKGTRLVIHVKEGILSGEELEAAGEEAPSGIAASRSGTVISILTRKGRPLVQAGDAVEKGDLLVSGVLPIYDDSGALASCQYTAADADILIRCERSYRDQTPISGWEKRYTGREKTAYLLRLGGSSFSLPDGFDTFAEYDLLSNLTQYRLAKNFYLPVYLQKFTAKEYEKTEILYTKEQMEQILQGNFLYFVKNLEEKGVQIFQNDVKIEWNEKYAIASGILITGENAVSRVAEDGSEEELRKNEYG